MVEVLRRLSRDPESRLSQFDWRDPVEKSRWIVRTSAGWRWPRPRQTWPIEPVPLIPRPARPRLGRRRARSGGSGKRIDGRDQYGREVPHPSPCLCLSSLALALALAFSPCGYGDQKPIGTWSGPDGGDGTGATPDGERAGGPGTPDARPSASTPDAAAASDTGLSPDVSPSGYGPGDGTGSDSSLAAKLTAEARGQRERGRLLRVASSRRTIALLCSGSRAANTSVTGPPAARWRSAPRCSAAGARASSAR
jgi:hypothetical protein